MNASATGRDNISKMYNTIFYIKRYYIIKVKSSENEKSETGRTFEILILTLKHIPTMSHSMKIMKMMIMMMITIINNDDGDGEFRFPFFLL